MSYARFGPHSDIYMFVAGYDEETDAFECCGCLLSEDSQSFTSVDAAVAHLKEHRDAGHKVPAGLEAVLIEDGDAALEPRRCDVEGCSKVYRIATPTEHNGYVFVCSSEHAQELGSIGFSGRAPKQD